MSDAEIVAISEASVSGGSSYHDPGNTCSLGAGQSRRDIMRDAIHDARLRDESMSVSRDINNRYDRVGEKRGNDGQLGPSLERETYAEAARRWNDVENKQGVTRVSSPSLV